MQKAILLVSLSTLICISLSSMESHPRKRLSINQRIKIRKEKLASKQKELEAKKRPAALEFYRKAVIEATARNKKMMNELKERWLSK